MHKTFTLFFLVLTSTVSFAQRHSKCDSGVELLAIGTKYGIGAQIGYMNYFSNRLFGKIDVYMMNERDRKLPHRVLGLRLTAGFTLFQLNDRFFFNIIAGGQGSYENSQKTGERVKYELKKYGVFGGGELEYYLSDKVSILADFTQSYLFEENVETSRQDIVWGQYRYIAMFGFRYHFYGKNCASPSRLHRSGR